MSTFRMRTEIFPDKKIDFYLFTLNREILKTSVIGTMDFGGTMATIGT
jgi:hypothetical protein